MREQNPAITLYQQWREVVRWRGESAVERLREAYTPYLREKKESPEQVKTRMLAAYTAFNYRSVPVNYRMMLTVKSLTDVHLDDRLFDDMDDWEPVITLTMRGRRGYVWEMFTLYPNGTFTFHAPPSRYHQALPEMVTFLRTSYAAGRRIWAVDSRGIPSRIGWFWFDEKDWTNPIPYTTNYSLIKDVLYRIIPAPNGHWKFDVVDTDSPSATTLKNGYAVAEQRYTRHERVATRTATAPRNKVAMYVPRHGLITGDEAVQRFMQSLRVYEPVSRP